jgi:hypothetical protein
MGGQAAWLLPAALIGMVAVLVARRKAPRTDTLRAAAIIWGGWLLVTGAVFSYGKGVIHTYYTVALAPAIAALVALGAFALWKERQHVWARIIAAVTVAFTAGWAWALLDRTPTWEPAVRWIVVLAGATATLAILGAPVMRRSGRWFSLTLAALVAVACLSGPVAYAADTIATGHTGSIPTAGPASSGGQGGVGQMPGGGPGGGKGAGSGHSGGIPSFARGTAPTGSTSHSGTPPTGAKGGSTSRGGGTSIGGGGGGSTSTSSALVKALESDAAKYKWVAAVDGSQNAASIELATSGEPVMAIGGFNGQGGNLSLSAFEKYVAAGDIHYYIGGSSGVGMGGGGNSSSAIATWVAAHFKAVTIGGSTVYDLTSGTS